MKLTRIEPNELGESDTERFATHTSEFEARVYELLDRLLAAPDSDVATGLVENFVFNPNDAIPKRGRRPGLRSPYLNEQIYRSYSETAAHRDDLLAVSILINEYFDVLDDIIDGDVTEGYELQVFLTVEFLQPLTVRYLHRLGDEAVSYWFDNTTLLLECFLDEHRMEPTAENYATLLEKQSRLFGLLSGMSALVANADSEHVANAEQLGKALFKMYQFHLDVAQYPDDSSVPWNVCHLLDTDEIGAEMARTKRRAMEHLERVPDGRIELIRPMITLDVDSWVASI